MSRSRPPKCPCGRGCGVCGNAGESRRKREDDAYRADTRELGDPLDAVLRQQVDEAYIDDEFNHWPEMDRK